MKKRLNKGKPAAILVCIFAALLLCLAGYQAVQGFWDSDQAVHMDNASVENSTLFIGTHLIHLSAMTDELYETALQSAADSMQDHRYYKSELAGGTWFDITGAVSLSDISTAGKPVTVKEMEQLFAEYHTKADGITYDLRTGKAVDIFDIVNPYELEKMEELSPLKMQLDLIRERETEGEEAEWFKKRVEEFFATEVQTEETDQIDKELDALYVYQTALKKKEEERDKTDAVEEVLSHVDADRRYAVFSVVSEAVNSLMEDLNGVTDAKPEDYKTDSGLSDAVNESISNVETALITWEGKALQEGESVLSRTKYSLSRKLIKAAENNSMEVCDDTTARLACLKNITADTISDREGELALLEDTLIMEAERAYRRLLTEQEPGGGEEAAERTAADTHEAGLSAALSEFEFFMEARTMRLSNEEAMDYLEGQVSKIAGYGSAIPSDRFGALSNSSLSELNVWLEDRLSSLSSGAGGNEADKLAAQKEELKTEYMAALDENDLERAKGLEQQLNELEEQLDALELEQTERVAELERELAELKEELAGTDPKDERKINDLNVLIGPKEEELARLRSELPAGSLGRKAAELKKEAIPLISENPSEADAAHLSELTDALMNLLPADYKTVFPLVQELLDAMVRQKNLNGSHAYDSLIKQTEDIIAANRAAYDSALRKELSAEELLAIAEDFLGETGTEGSAGEGEGSGSWETGRTDFGDTQLQKKQAVLLYALSLYKDSGGSKEAEPLLKAQTQKAVLAENPLVFQSLREPAAQYISVRAAAAYTGMRYVWNETQYRAILADRNLYYEFTAFSDRVKTEKEEKKLQAPARFQKQVYIPESFALEAFGCGAVSAAGTGCSVIMDEDMQKTARELCALLLKGGE